MSMIDPSSFLAKVEDWYDNYYIFGFIGALLLIIIVMILVLFYLGARFAIDNV